MIVVVDQRELAQPEVAGQRGGFAANPFHHVAVAHEGPHPVVNYLVAWLIELARQDSLGDRHPHGVPHALPQRTGGDLDPGRVSTLRMPGCPRAPLTEVLQLIERQVVSGQMQDRVLQHRGVAAGQNEPIAIGPRWISGIVLEETGPERKRCRRERHGRSRVA